MSGPNPSGFAGMRFPDLRRRLQEELRAKFTDDLDFGSASVLGRLVDIPALQLASVWELAESVLHERAPDSASGATLSDVAALLGLSRADRSRVELLLGGQPGAVVPAGSLVRSVGVNPQVEFATEHDATLQPMNVPGYRVTILHNLPLCTYTITVDGQAYPVQTGAVGQSYNITGAFAAALSSAPVELASVSGAELHLLAQDLNTPLSVGCSWVAPKLTDVLISWLPVYTYTLKVNGQDFSISSNSGAPGQSDPTTLLMALLSQIRAVFPSIDGYVHGTLPKVLRLCGPSSMTVSRVPNSSASRITLSYPKVQLMSVAAEAGVRGVSTAIARATAPGPVDAAADVLRQIASPVAGWSTVRNPQAVFALGSDESDTAFRRRRLRTLRVADASVPEAIRDAVAAVEGVAKVTLVENCEPQIVSGRPPHSVEVVVQNVDNTAQNDARIAERLWQVKPAGIALVSTVGTAVQRTILDSMGFSHTIAFSRPVVVPVRVAVLTMAHPEEERPAQWQQLIRDAIAALGNQHSMGEDVIHSRILGEVFSVPGVYQAMVVLSRWPGGPPQAADLTMNFAEIARFNPLHISVQ